MTKKFYVYVHYRLDNDSPFYVGKGTRHRDTRTSGRSKWWDRIVAKHGYYSIRVAHFDAEKEAFLKEITLINDFKFLGFKLCNLTSGGEGASGMVFTKDHRAKLSAAQQGKVFSLESREKMSETRQGAPMPVGSLSSSFKGVVTATSIASGEVILIFGTKQMNSLGFNPGHISKCLTGKAKTHKGYTFHR